MFVVLAAAWGLAFLIRYGQDARATRAAMDATVCFGLYTVLICEALSLPAWYTAAAVLVCWLLFCAAACALFARPLRAGLSKALALRPGRLPWYAWMGGAVIGVCLLGTLLSALLYPPMNYDSMVYHIPRVFFWMKNASVHNYPTEVGRQLFTGPLAGFFVLQVQVLAGGSDRLANLAQWFAYAGSVLAVAGIASELGAGPRGRWLSATLAATTPLAILQASSTQSDMVAAFWCVATAYYVTAYWRSSFPGGRGERLWWAVCAGGAAGLALLTKLNTLAVVGSLGLLVFGLMCKRRAWRDMRRLIAPALACALVINIGFFARNAADLDGDFLAFDLPETNQQHVPSNDPRIRLALTAKNLTYNLTNTPVPMVNWVAAGFAARVCTWMGAGLNAEALSLEKYAHQEFAAVQLHDNRTSPLQSAMGYAAVALLLLAALGRRKHRRFPAALALAVLAGYVGTAAMLRYTSSIPRYLLPSLLIALGLVPSAFGGGGRGPARVRRGIACASVVIAVYLAAGPLLFNMFQPLVYAPKLARALSSEPMGLGRFSASYNRMRAFSTGISEQGLAAIRERADAAGVRTVGVTDCILGVYPALYAFRDARYDVRYVDARYLSEREDPAFVPDAILTMDYSEHLPGRIAVRGAEYVLAETHSAIIAPISLYLRE
ncbi:MAG: phospholipid carrier-dependent glycosyltransferase [Clostridia bacterium]|nr:phospholipid carrier-dependent glycosyltransferase [Clostridia bacterium]